MNCNISQVTGCSSFKRSDNIPGVTVHHDYKSLSEDKLYPYPVSGFSALYKSNPKLFKKYVKIFSKLNPKSKVSVNILQNNSGVEVMASSKSKASEPCGADILLRKKIHSDGIFTESRTEIYPVVDGYFFTETHYKNSNRHVLTKLKPLKGDDDFIVERFDIISDEKDEPSELIHSKVSDLLQYTYDVTRYSFKDYSEEIDVLTKASEGTLDGGEPLSRVYKDTDGSVILRQNFSANGCSIRRFYKQNGPSYEYSYYIDDENNRPLLRLDRSFRKNPDGSTFTRINDKEYTAVFNDSTKIAHITDNDGQVMKINLHNKIYHFNEAKHTKCYEYLKTLPADKIMQINKFTEFFSLTDNIMKATSKPKRIRVIEKLPIVSHEIGHSIDVTVDNGNLITSNKELVQIYNDEMDSFNKIHTDDEQLSIKYLSRMGGGNFSTGIAEFFADANALLTTYGYDYMQLAERSEFLVRNFPKTISKIASILGYNAV